MPIRLADNLKLLREAENLTQQQIADKLGLKKTTYGNYETGFSKNPDFLVLYKISKLYGVSLEELIFEDVRLTKKLVQEKSSKNVRPNVRPSVRLIQKTDDLEPVRGPVDGPPGNVYILETKAAAGVPALLVDEDKLKDQPTLYLPELGTGIHIRMQVHGDSMHSTIKDGDNVIATWQPEPLQTLREGHIYLIIDKEDGVVCKRVYKAAKDTWEFESDNDTYKPYKRHLSNILAVFRVVEVHTSDLRNYYADTRKEITKIWKAIEEIKRMK